MEISNVVVTGNTAKVQLSGDVEGDVKGYDFVISKAEDYITERAAVNKNVKESIKITEQISLLQCTHFATRFAKRRVPDISRRPLRANSNLRIVNISDPL